MRFYTMADDEPYAELGREDDDNESRTISFKPNEKIVGAGFQIRDSIPVSIQFVIWDGKW